MSKAVQPLDRRDVKRMFEARLHQKGRDDIKVEVGFFVKFGVDEQTFVNTVIDPYQPLPRYQANQISDMAISKLEEEVEKQIVKSNEVPSGMADAVQEAISD